MALANGSLCISSRTSCPLRISPTSRTTSRNTAPGGHSSSAVNSKEMPDVWPPKDEKPYGGKLKSGFTSDLKSLKEEISRALPKVGGKALADLESAGKATAEASAKAGPRRRISVRLAPPRD